MTTAGDPTVAVVGAGISGLAAAWEVTQRAPGARVVVLERSTRAGGLIHAVGFGGRVVETGADAFVARRPEAVELCRELGIEHELVAPAWRRAYVWSDRGMLPLPAGLALGIPTDMGALRRSGLVDRGAAVRASLGAMVPRPRMVADGADASVGALVGPTWGRQVVARLVDPLIGGIHAGSVDELSAAAVYPALHQAASRPGRLVANLRRLVPPSADGESPIFLVPRTGTSRLVQRLVEALTERGVDIRTGIDIRALKPGAPLELRAADGSTVAADAVVLAVPAQQTASLVEQSHGPMATILRAIPYADVALVTMRFAGADVAGPLDGTGYLVPRGEALVTACTFLSSKWPQLARPDDVLLRVSVGRAGDRRALELDDDTLVRVCVDELRPAVGLQGAPIDAMVVRYRHAFPQYRPGHLELIDDLERMAPALGNAALAGALLRGVGIPACIGSGRRAGRTVLERLARSRP